jgi:hypothetical protein
MLFGNKSTNWLDFFSDHLANRLAMAHLRSLYVRLNVHQHVRFYLSNDCLFASRSAKAVHCDDHGNNQCGRHLASLQRNSIEQWLVHRSILGRHLQRNRYQRGQLNQVSLRHCHGAGNKLDSSSPTS